MKKPWNWPGSGGRSAATPASFKKLPDIRRLRHAQRIGAGGQHIGRRQAGPAFRAGRRGSPVGAVCVAEIVPGEPGDYRMRQQDAGLQFRGARRGCARIRWRDRSEAGPRASARRLAAVSAATAARVAERRCRRRPPIRAASMPSSRGLAATQLVAVMGIIQRSGEAVLGCEAIVDRRSRSARPHAASFWQTTSWVSRSPITQPPPWKEHQAGRKTVFLA